MLDLILILLFTLMTIPVVEFTQGIPRIILGVIVLLIFPGYSLMSALFPNRIGPFGMERAGLTFIFSFATVSLGGLILNYTPWGINLTSIIISVTFMIIVFCGIAFFRRSRITVEDRFSLNIKFKFPRWSNSGSLDRLLSIALIVIVIGSMSSLAYAIAKPKTEEHFTNFYMLGKDKKMEEYPSIILIDDQTEVTLCIENHEKRVVTYSIKEMVEGNVVQTIGPITLNAEEIWLSPVIIKPPGAGENQKVDFLLYRDQDLNPYLNLHIWLDVKIQ